MALAALTRLGSYEVLSTLGGGGIARCIARGTKLKRDVAIKILPEMFAQDGDRLARFQREAETLATLNHPNIAAVYGLEDANGVAAIVMELVEGATLADHSARGAMPSCLHRHLNSLARVVVTATDAPHRP